MAANVNTSAGLIVFAIPGACPHTIYLTTLSPTITDDGLTINGYTQQHAIENTLAIGSDAVIQIRIVGRATTGGAGLGICADNTTIRGLSITGFADAAITIERQSAPGGCPDAQPDGIGIEGNFLGLAPDGVTRAANRVGISTSTAATCASAAISRRAT